MNTFHIFSIKIEPDLCLFYREVEERSILLLFYILVQVTKIIIRQINKISLKIGKIIKTLEFKENDFFNSNYN